MCKFIWTIGYIDIHRDINLKFCVLLFHERFWLLCQMMDKVFIDMKVFNPLEIVLLYPLEGEYWMVDCTLTNHQVFCSPKFHTHTRYGIGAKLMSNALSKANQRSFGGNIGILNKRFNFDVLKLCKFKSWMCKTTCKNYASKTMCNGCIVNYRKKKSREIYKRFKSCETCNKLDCCYKIK